MQSPETVSEEQALASAQEGQIAAQHLELDCQSVTSETSHASSAHDSVDNQRVSPMPHPIPIALTLAQPPDSAEREYATLTPLSSAVTMSHAIAPVHYASYVPVPLTVAVSAVETAPAAVTTEAQPLAPMQAQVSPQPQPIILTAVPARKPTPIQHVQPTLQKQVVSGKANAQVLPPEELTRDQLVLLEKAYRDSPYPSYHTLAAELKIEVFKVKAWFRKRRRNLHTEIGIEMSKEDEQKVFKQFISQHHDSWKGGQPPSGTPQSSQSNTMFRIPTPSPGEGGQKNNAEEGKSSKQENGDHGTNSPAQVAASSGNDVTLPEPVMNQSAPVQNQGHPPTSAIPYPPQQVTATTTKSKSLPKSSRQTKSKSSTSTIRSLLKKEIKYEPAIPAPVVAAPPPVSSPQPQMACIPPENPTQTMTYIPTMYQNPEIDNLMREREYLGRLLHQQQMEWQETRKKLVDCDRRLAKATSNIQATTYTTASQQQTVVSEGDQKWHQAPQTQYHQVVVPATAAHQYVTQAERPPSQGSPAVTTDDGQPPHLEPIPVVMVQSQDSSSAGKEDETDAPQLTQLYAAAPIITHQGGENHYAWHHEHHQQEAVQYHPGMYQAHTLDGNNNKDQALQSTTSVENSQGQPSPYYSDYSGSPASSHDTQENHNSSGGANKRRNRTTFTREQINQLEAYYKANAHPELGDREQMAATLGLTERNVRIWFKNRRSKKVRQVEWVPVIVATEDT